MMRLFYLKNRWKSVYFIILLIFLKFGSLEDLINWKITISVVVKKAPACFVRSIAMFRSDFFLEDIASVTKWTLKPCLSASNKVFMTQTWASIPQIMMFFFFCWFNFFRKSLLSRQLNSVFSIKVCFFRICLISFTVFPSPLGYCSVSRIGTFNSCNELISLLMFFIRLPQLQITGLNFSCRSITKRRELFLFIIPSDFFTIDNKKEGGI